MSLGSVGRMVKGLVVFLLLANEEDCNAGYNGLFGFLIKVILHGRYLE